MMSDAQKAAARRSHTVVFYHGSCPDGATAAAVAAKKLGTRGVFFKSCYYGDDDLPDCTGKDVYVLDYSFSWDVTEKITSVCKTFTLLDHHETSARKLYGFNCTCGKLHFDMQKSGARLAWDHFFPNQDVPWLVKYVEDRDLWKWEFPETAAVLAMVDLKYGHDDFRKLIELLDITEHELQTQFRFAEQGQMLLDYRAKLYEEILRDAIEITLDGHKTLAVQAPASLTSEVGQMLHQKTGTFGLVWRITSSGVKCGLRSNDDFACNTIAEKFGGGGHPQAAGFLLKASQLADLLNSQL